MTESDIANLTETFRSFISEKVYDTESIKKISPPDIPSSWWIFNFKDVFFYKETARMAACLFWNKIAACIDTSRPIAIGGMESGAIPLISALTLHAPNDLNVCGFFVRKSRKKSDLANVIEGNIPTDAQIIIVDDVLNRGTSLEKLRTILAAEGRVISLFFTIIRYRDVSAYTDASGGVPLYSLYELNDFPEHGLKNLIGKSKTERFTYTPLWSVSLSKPQPYHVIPKSSPLLYKGTLYQGTDDGTFYALDPQTGETKWSYRVLFGAEGKRIYSSPVFWNDLIFFGAYDGNLYALNAHSGKREWIFFDGDWIGSSPTVAHDLKMVFVGLEFGLLKKRGGVASIDVRTGKSKWTFYEMTGLTHASPAYSSQYKVVVCGSNDGIIYCLEAKTGTLRWTMKTQGEVKYGATFDDSKGVVYVGSMDGSVYALDIKNGTILNKFTARFGFYSNPIIYKNTLIAGSLDKKIYCWDRESGKEVWTHETSGRVFATPVLSNDRIYIGSNDGRLRVIDPHNGELLGSVLLAERIVNKVQVDGDIIFIPTHACELFAFKEKLKSS